MTKRTNKDGDFLSDDDHLDADVLTKNLPFLAKGPVKDFIEKLNSVDTNHDGQDDVTQVARLLKKAVPILLAIAPYVNWKGFLAHFVENPNIVPPESRSEVKAHVASLLDIADEAVALAPKK